ncbi:MAG TPA: hypothetical protein VFJ87_03690 [Rhodanobacteraceae bacterium]|nr:hypothetical protein [Rhodanobacteraceae bacterium]
MRTLNSRECFGVAGGDDAPLEHAANAAASIAGAAALCGAEPVAVAAAACAATIYIYELL